MTPRTAVVTLYCGLSPAIAGDPDCVVLSAPQRPERWQTALGSFLSVSYRFTAGSCCRCHRSAVTSTHNLRQTQEQGAHSRYTCSLSVEAMCRPSKVPVWLLLQGLGPARARRTCHGTLTVPYLMLSLQRHTVWCFSNFRTVLKRDMYQCSTGPAKSIGVWYVSFRGRRFAWFGEATDG